jgi:hypothetical protein
MVKHIAFISALLAAPLAQAGDYVGGYILVVGSLPSTIRVEEMTDVGRPVFRDTIATLSKEWSEKCAARVDIWHTNLIDNEANPWTPDHWVAYIAFEETEAEAYSVAPATACISESYAKYGDMTFPTLFQICAQPDVYPELYEQSCQ